MKQKSLAGRYGAALWSFCAVSFFACGPTAKQLQEYANARQRAQEVRMQREAAAKAGSEESPSESRPWGRASAGKAGIEWVSIPGGTFMMGYGARDWPEARPIHQVEVKSFQLAKTLVTFGQYKKCVDDGACAPAHVSDGSCRIWDGSKSVQGTLPDSFQGDDQPVVCVDWGQAQAFAAWAGGRLPTEAEWEYAARSAGKDWQHPWGDDEASCKRAVMDDGGNGCGMGSTWPVCGKPKGNTEQGLCDMAGNVWEWVQDWYHDSYNGAPIDGSAWESPAGSHRVVRCGSWSFDAEYLRAAYRLGDDPAYRFDGYGFRLARSSR